MVMLGFSLGGGGERMFQSSWKEVGIKPSIVL